MTDEAMSPLRRRMIEDMTIRKFAPRPNTTTCKESRTRWVSRAVAGYGDVRGVRRYQLHLVASVVACEHSIDHIDVAVLFPGRR